MSGIMAESFSAQFHRSSNSAPFFSNMTVELKSVQNESPLFLQRRVMLIGQYPVNGLWG